jgi:hypothetical protein
MFPAVVVDVEQGNELARGLPTAEGTGMIIWASTALRYSLGLAPKEVE